MSRVPLWSEVLALIAVYMAVMLSFISYDLTRIRKALERDPDE